MQRKLFGLFSGAHVTLMICTALLAPSALYATVAFSPVAITDANSGIHALVDSSQRVYTYDQVAGYTNNPYHLVNITDFVYTSIGEHSVFTIPKGKALILKSVTWNYGQNTEGNNNVIYFKDGSQNFLFELNTTHAAGSQSVSFDAGIVVKAGPLALNPYGIGWADTYIQGYLVPLAALPPAGSPEAAEQFTISGSPPRR